jgi:hypothetical protein
MTKQRQKAIKRQRRRIVSESGMIMRFSNLRGPIAFSLTLSLHNFQLINPIYQQLTDR